jgi:hypothetical protein
LTSEERAGPVLELALAIRLYLPELVGDDAPALDEELLRQIERADEPAILGLLAARPATHRWGARFLVQGAPPDLKPERSAEGGPGELYGDPGPVSVRRYRCAHGDATGYRRTAGAPPPRCPTHHTPMEPAGLVTPGGP